MAGEAKYPISDEDMCVLLEKYPFLKVQKAYGDGEDLYDDEQKNIEYNHYKHWDGSGWENLWKNRYLPRLFKAYDSWDDEQKKSFCFLDIKSKYGGMRVYTSGNCSEENLESKAESLSEWICEFCGAEPRDAEGHRMIWSTNGWIITLCEECARKYLKERLELTDAEINTELESMKHVLNRPFGYIRFSTDGNTRVTYKETDDGWLETDTVVKEDKEIFKKQFIAGLTGKEPGD